jgi:hypothetical protein
MGYVVLNHWVRWFGGLTCDFGGKCGENSLGDGKVADGFTSHLSRGEAASEMGHPAPGRRQEKKNAKDAKVAQRSRRDARLARVRRLLAVLAVLRGWMSR